MNKRAVYLIDWKRGDFRHEVCLIKKFSTVENLDYQNALEKLLIGKTVFFPLEEIKTVNHKN